VGRLRFPGFGAREKKTDFGRKLRKLRELKRQFDTGWLLAEMHGLGYSPVQKKFA
jgi:hypothetical protein